MSLIVFHMKLLVEYRVTYGNPLFAPRCAASRAICKIMNRKHFTREQLLDLKASGRFSLKVLTPELTKGETDGDGNQDHAA